MLESSASEWKLKVWSDVGMDVDVVEICSGGRVGLE